MAPQNGRAPLLFMDEEASTRGSFFHTARRPGLVACPEVHYDMFVLPVPVLLRMTRFLPHQELLRRRLLERWTPDMRGRIIFVSHQWLGYAHPDPGNEHLSTLKQLLQRLLDGQVGKVESHWLQQIVFQQNTQIDPPRWRAALPHMFVWLDYISIPQIGVRVQEEEAAAQTRLSAASSLDAQAGAAGADACAAAVANLASDASGEAREGDAESVRQMALAVESIHAYVERSALLLVLVPVCAHHDQPITCDYSTWRSRGWCRMELQAALLARTNVRVMICHGPHATPHLIKPVDALQLPAGEGLFTCCTRGHLINGRRIKCDKKKVLRHVAMMLDTKAAHLRATGRVTDARFFACARHLFLKGLQSPTSAPEDRQAAVEGLKRKLAWCDRTDVVAARRTGWTLLQYAVLDDNAQAVHQLLLSRQQGGEGADPNVYIRKGDPHLTILSKSTPLIVAMMYARWEIAEALLDARADPRCVTSGVHSGLDAFMLGTTFGAIENVERWLERFPNWYLERMDSFAGETVFQQVAIIRRCSAAHMRIFAAGGANAGHVDNFGATILHSLTSKDDADLEAAKVLLDDCHADVNARQKPRVLKWWVLMRTARMAAAMGSRRFLVMEMARWEGGTPLSNAAAHGNVAMVRVLLAGRADPSIRNAQGRTPLEVAAAAFGGEVPQALQDAFEGSSPAAAPGGAAQPELQPGAAVLPADSSPDDGADTPPEAPQSPPWLQGWVRSRAATPEPPPDKGNGQEEPEDVNKAAREAAGDAADLAQVLADLEDEIRSIRPHAPE